MPKLKKFHFIIIGVVLTLLVIGFLTFKNLNSSEVNETDDLATPTEALPTIDSSVVVDLDFTANKKSMILTISNIPEGTETIDYEISYLTGEGLPKGNIGSLKVEGKSEVKRSGEELTLGTCSRGKCVYYEGVTKVSLSLKFKKSDGSAAIFQKDYDL
ncbi:hypothetical protein HY407_03870 [Candidatus Gottesmanbacteria bacterium]|nr:hypothetical protein [Candidatus Gottesmanbacteria bacterium]